MLLTSGGWRPGKLQSTGQPHQLYGPRHIWCSYLQKAPSTEEHFPRCSAPRGQRGQCKLGSWGQGQCGGEAHGLRSRQPCLPAPHVTKEAGGEGLWTEGRLVRELPPQALAVLPSKVSPAKPSGHGVQDCPISSSKTIRIQTSLKMGYFLGR